jgi:hypothetical protein
LKIKSEAMGDIGHMFMLAEKFMKTLKEIGLSQLEQPIFYHAPVGLRFEIGGEGKVYQNNSANPKYIRHALDRAWTIYKELPSVPDILQITVCGDYGTAEKSLSEIPLPDFDEGIEEQDGTQTSFYWDCSKLPKDTAKALFREIILADIGGNNLLTSSVFWMSTEGKYLFHLYDDRGADLISADKEILLPIYHKFHSWLLDYDRERMDKLFSEWNIVSDQKGIDNLQQEYGGFHDTCLVKLEYTTGSYVDEKGGMANGTPEEKELSMTFHSQWTKRPLELCFGGVRKLCIAGWQENYFCEILDCCLRFYTDLIPGRDVPLIVWADSASFSPKNVGRQLIEEPITSYVIAETLKWRYL